MRKTITAALAAAMALITAPAHAQERAPDPNQVTIYIDNTAKCSMTRSGQHYERKARQQANELRRELKAEGKQVRIVTVPNGTVLEQLPNHSPVIRAPC